MKQLPAFLRLHRGPLFWPAFTFGLLLFALTRWLPGLELPAVQNEALSLDQAYARVLRNDPTAYQVLDNVPQTYGARVLTRYAQSLVSILTGDTARAGLWLSLAGLVTTFAGMYALCLSIFPFRPFALAAIAALAGIGAIQMSLSPDPSIALGMALVVWGIVAFFTALQKVLPERIFLSGLLIGLAGYIHIELSLLWILLALYLITMGLYNSPARARGTPVLAMAFGGLLTVAAVLWPMINRNLLLATSPILPGYDAELILGAPADATAAAAIELFPRFLEGFRMLATDPRALGIFAGLLWPAGILISTLVNRHKALPWFWVPFIILWVLLLTVMSPVTGHSSFTTCLLITTPLLIPFAVLVLMYPFYIWFQKHPAAPGHLVLGSAALVALSYALALIPTVLAPAPEPESTRTEDLIQLFKDTPGLRNAPLLTDRPGLFLGLGKQNVHGLNGETDWQIMLAKTADGNIQPAELLKYLETNNIQILHLARHDSPLPDQLRTLPDFPGLTLLNVSPPHRVYRLHPSEPL